MALTKKRDVHVSTISRFVNYDLGIKSYIREPTHTDG